MRLVPGRLRAGGVVVTPKAAAPASVGHSLRVTVHARCRETPDGSPSARRTRGRSAPRDQPAIAMIAHGLVQLGWAELRAAAPMPAPRARSRLRIVGEARASERRVRSRR